MHLKCKTHLQSTKTFNRSETVNLGTPQVANIFGRKSPLKPAKIVVTN